MPERKAGEKSDVAVCTPPGFFANNPQVIRTDREVILAFGMQEIDKLLAIRIHQHYQPFSRLHWSISTDGGYTWRTTDLAPDVGKVLDASYGEPLHDGAMVTMSFTRSFITPYAFIQKGHVGMMPYSNHLPAVEAVPLTDFGPFESFYFHAMTRTSDGALLAGGYAQIPGSEGRESYTALFLRSEDEGRSWRYLSHIPQKNVFAFSESGIVAGENGHVLALLRADWDYVPQAQRPPEAQVGYGYFLYQTESQDNGLTWSAPVQLPIWGHPPYLLRLQSGAIVLVYGHRRPPYSVRAILSRDEGKTWDMKTLRALRVFDPGNYDIGYPQVTQLADGTILCAYYGYSTQAVQGTLNPCGIFVSLFDEEWLSKDGDIG